ncbi:unnamed protein product [Rhizoctonia solani]|uniref:Uncharacterized protein n=1 Tax=Rhizoctonia solani TaxID=456999 RepID=A0A8H3DTS6_9AGAM|nr:unnamed protein product [Rhizoctonia solani]
MGNTKTSAPVVKVPDDTLPPMANLPNELYPTLMKILDFLGNLVFTLLAYWFPEVVLVLYSDSNKPQRRRGVQQALVLAPPLLAPIALAHVRAPNRLQRLLLFLISACCSSMAVVWLTNMLGAANVPPAVNLPLDLPRVLDIVNESTGHLSRNVAAAGSGVCYLKVGIDLVDLVCRTGYGVENPLP